MNCFDHLFVKATYLLCYFISNKKTRAIATKKPVKFSDFMCFFLFYLNSPLPCFNIYFI